jgi:hypothetical protein
MVGQHPRSIGVGDFIINPDECAPGCPVDEGAGLPMQAGALVVLIRLGRLWPDHNFQLRQTYPRGDAVVRISHPCGGPDQITT